MGFASRLLGLTARIGLDLLIGSRRADEAVALVSEWFASRSPEEQSAEVATARQEAADMESVRSAITQAGAADGRALSGQQVDELAMSVSAGLDALSATAAPDLRSLVEQLNSRRGTYAVWLDVAAVRAGGSGRYCHFNWDGESYRVRDFIGGRIFHPPGRKVSEQGLQAVELPMTALAVWQASCGRIQCLSRYGLAFPVGERERWSQVLRLMTELAGLWQARGDPGVAVS